MLTKTKIALAAALIAGTASAALAQEFDGNPANRYPGYDNANAAAPYLGTVAQGTIQSAPVRLNQGRKASQAGAQYGNFGGQQSEVDAGLTDRASSPYAAGGGN